MKALSIKQPWASLIAHGIKDIENRTWKTKFRGRIYIHACGKYLNRSTIYDVLNEKQWDFTFDEINRDKFDADNLYYSAIIGEVEIVDCVINHPSIWAEKTFMYEYDEQVGEKPVSKPIYNWVLANPVLYDKPILNVKGKLSFWDPTMSQEKLYFKSIDHTTCHSLEWHLEDAKLEDLQEITLVEAIPDNDNPDYVWCTHYENAEEKNQCRKSFCPGYESKSGRGVCEHRGNLYCHGNEVKFDVPICSKLKNS